MSTKLFPRKVMITQDIIDKADIGDPFNCIGAMTLLSAFNGTFIRNVSWGVWGGFIELRHKTYSVVTKEMVNMTEVKEPIEVTLVKH